MVSNSLPVTPTCIFYERSSRVGLDPLWIRSGRTESPPSLFCISSLPANSAWDLPMVNIQAFDAELDTEDRSEPRVAT